MYINDCSMRAFPLTHACTFSKRFCCCVVLRCVAVQIMHIFVIYAVNVFTAADSFVVCLRLHSIVGRRSGLKTLRLLDERPFVCIEWTFNTDRQMYWMGKRCERTIVATYRPQLYYIRVPSSSSTFCYRLSTAVLLSRALRCCCWVVLSCVGISMAFPFVRLFRSALELRGTFQTHVAQNEHRFHNYIKWRFSCFPVTC